MLEIISKFNDHEDFPFFPTMSKSWEFKGRKECGVARRPRFRDEF